MDEKIKVMTVFDTSLEIIKMAPLIKYEPSLTEVLLSENPYGDGKVS